MTLWFSACQWHPNPPLPSIGEVTQASIEPARDSDGADTPSVSDDEPFVWPEDTGATFPHDTGPIFVGVIDVPEAAITTWFNDGFAAAVGPCQNVLDHDGDGVADYGLGQSFGFAGVRFLNGVVGVPERWLSEADGSIAGDFGGICGAGDQDGDGRDDIALYLKFVADTTTQIFNGPMLGTRFGTDPDVWVGGVGAPAPELGYPYPRLDDYTGDGLADLVVGDAQYHISVAAGPLDGEIMAEDVVANLYSELATLAETWEVGELFPWEERAADVNGDGTVDILVSGNDQPWLVPGPLGAGGWVEDIGFRIEPGFIDVPGGGGGKASIRGDVDGDGHLDLVVVAGGGNLPYSFPQFRWVQIGLRQAAPRREGSCAGTFVWRRDGRPVSRAAARIRSSARDTNGFHWPFSSMFDAAELDDGLSPAAHPAHASLVAALGDDVLDGSLDLTCADLEAS